jgi:hypothetical protein
MQSALPLNLVAIATLGFILLAQPVHGGTLSNPCLSDHESCGQGTSDDRCGYGSTCVGSSLEEGSCKYQVGDLGCGDECLLPVGSVFPSQFQCDLSLVCDSVSDEDPTTCGYIDKKRSGCTCNTTSECVTQWTCTNGTCQIQVFPGFPCTKTSDCFLGLPCTGGVCQGLAENEVCPGTTYCQYGLVCATSPLGGSRCQPYTPIGGNCTSLEPGKCVPYGRCDTVLNQCANLYNSSDGSACQSASACQPTSGCVSGVCTNNGACSASLGSTGCPYQTACGCTEGSSTPSCIGNQITPECANASIEFERCMFNNLTKPSYGNVLPMNIAPVPEVCRCAFQRLYCSTTCPSPMLAVDYNLIDCCAGNWVPYTTSQNNTCYRDYCVQPHFNESFMHNCTLNVCGTPLIPVPPPDPTPSPSTPNGNVAYEIAMPILAVGVVIAVVLGASLGGCPRGDGYRAVRTK